MTREEVIRIAGEVGAYRYENRYLKYEPTHTFTVEKLEAFAELAAAVCKQDALRYRWLREQHWSSSDLAVVKHPRDAVKLGHYCPSEDLLDKEIDKAMEVEK